MSRVNYSTRDREDSNFFMVLFQYYYSQSNLTLSDIAKATDISSNALTLMKNGQKVISFQVFEKLYRLFTQKQFNFDDTIYQEISDLFTRMVSCHILIDEQEMIRIIHEILDNQERYENSFGFFLYHLTSFFWLFWRYDNDSITTVMDRSKINAEKDLLAWGEECFTPFQQAFFLDIRGLCCIEQTNVEEGLKYLEKARLNCPELPVKGLSQSIQYHIARISDKTNTSVKGYMICQELCSYYAAEHNPVRYCYIENVMIYLLTDMGKFREAHEQALSLMKAAKTMKDPDIERFVIMTLIWNAISAGWAQTALAYLQRPDLAGKLSLHISGYEPLMLYKAGQIEEAKASLALWRNHTRPRKIELLHAMLDDLFEERKRMFLRSCTAFITYCKKTGFRQSERLGRILKLETTRRFNMQEEYVEALKEFIAWQYPKPEEPELPAFTGENYKKSEA